MDIVSNISKQDLKKTYNRAIKTILDNWVASKLNADGHGK